MMNKDFQGKLTKFGNKTKAEGEVVTEFVIQTEEFGYNPSFLDSYSEEFGNTVNKCLDYPEWNTISYNVSSHMKLDFDGFNGEPLPVELVQIKVSKKEKETEIKFVYSLVFHKVMNNTVDPVLATTYLKRKEEDENGKMKIATYPITLTKAF